MTLQVLGLSLSFGKRPILKGLSFVAKPGELNFIVGPNGAGKTTLLNVLSGLLKPSEGVVTLHGANIHEWSPENRAARIASLGQHPHSPPDLSVAQSIAMGINGARAAFDFDRRHLPVVQEHAEEMGIEALTRKRLSEISGGERRLVFAARTLIQAHAGLYIFDEPDTHLDRKKKKFLMEAIRKRIAPNAVGIVTSHDLNVVESYAERILVMEDGQIIEDLRGQEQNTSEILHRATQGF